MGCSPPEEPAGAGPGDLCLPKGLRLPEEGLTVRTAGHRYWGSQVGCGVLRRAPPVDTSEQAALLPRAMAGRCVLCRGPDLSLCGAGRSLWGIGQSQER